jgi:hypothetical protein
MGFIFITIAGLWVLIDFVVTLFGSMKDGQGRVIKTW